jgi:glycosyltransferase involved in cell wall biosynthesis
MKLSVVLGTLNRLPHLQKCLDSVERSCGGIEHEVIVVDGGSTDGTVSWLRQKRDKIITIEQGAAYGAVYAYNAGFFAAEGDYVASLNDDCEVKGDTLKAACDYLDTHEHCGQVAIPWHDKGDIDIRVMHVGLGRQMLDVIYANFGVTRRWLGDKVGWWGNYLEHYGGDCELSFMIWSSGYTVDELKGAEILHSRVQDRTRRICYFNAAFASRWYGRDVSHVIKRLDSLGYPINYLSGAR